MRLSKRGKKSSDCFSWRCIKGCCKEQNLRSRTSFENLRLTIRQIVKFTYFWARKVMPIGSCNCCLFFLTYACACTMCIDSPGYRSPGIRCRFHQDVRGLVFILSRGVCRRLLSTYGQRKARRRRKGGGNRQVNVWATEVPLWSPSQRAVGGVEHKTKRCFLQVGMDGGLFMPRNGKLFYGEW